MDLLLHIGTEKTGTTALQNWLHDNHTALADRGVWTCQSLEWPNNYGAAILAAGMDVWQDLLGAASIRSEADLAAYREATLARFGAEVAAARARGCDLFVVSSEHLHSRIRTASAVGALKGFLDRYFQNCRCVVFLRPQADLSRSVQSNHLRWGVPVSPQSYLETAQGHNYDYWSIYRLWLAAFGTALEVLPYKRHPDLIQWFLGQRHLAAGDFAGTSRRVKESVSTRNAAVLNALAKVLPSGPAHVALRERLIVETQCDAPLSFSRADRDRIERRFRRGNRRLCRAVAGLEEDDLRADDARYPVRGTVETLGDIDVSDVFADLLAKGLG